MMVIEVAIVFSIIIAMFEALRERNHLLVLLLSAFCSHTHKKIKQRRNFIDVLNK